MTNDFCSSYSRILMALPCSLIHKYKTQTKDLDHNLYSRLKENCGIWLLVQYLFHMVFWNNQLILFAHICFYSVLWKGIFLSFTVETNPFFISVPPLGGEINNLTELIGNSALYFYLDGNYVYAILCLEFR